MEFLSLADSTFGSELLFRSGTDSAQVIVMVEADCSAHFKLCPGHLRCVALATTAIATNHHRLQMRRSRNREIASHMYHTLRRGEQPFVSIPGKPFKIVRTTAGGNFVTECLLLRLGTDKQPRQSVLDLICVYYSVANITGLMLESIEYRDMFGWEPGAADVAVGTGREPRNTERTCRKPTLGCPCTG